MRYANAILGCFALALAGCPEDGHFPQDGGPKDQKLTEGGHIVDNGHLPREAGGDGKQDIIMWWPDVGHPDAAGPAPDQHVQAPDHGLVLPDRALLGPDRSLVLPDLPSAADVGLLPDTFSNRDYGAASGMINSSEISSGATVQLNRSLVRTSADVLYYCYRAGSAPYDLYISRSTDGGKTWGVWASKVNSESFAYDLSGCNLAVDKDNNLYAVWHRYSYSPTEHGTYFRRYHYGNGKWEPQVTIIQTANKVATSAVALDSQGYVYVLSGIAASWQTALHKSNVVGAADGKFTNLGTLTVSSYSQTGVLTVDANDNPHVMFYDVSSSAGVVYHRTYSGGAWQAAKVLSVADSNNDKTGPMAADAAGNVHMIFVEGGGVTTSTHTFQYVKWSATGTYSAPLTLWSHTAAQHGSGATANAHIINLAVDEASGDVFVVGRNLNEGGALCLYKKAAAASAFTLAGKLTSGSTAAHYFYLPRIRGTVSPSFNRTGKLLDIAWLEGASGSTYSRFARMTAP